MTRGSVYGFVGSHRFLLHIRGTPFVVHETDTPENVNPGGTESRLVVVPLLAPLRPDVLRVPEGTRSPLPYLNVSGTLKGLVVSHLPSTRQESTLYGVPDWFSLVWG